jgi:predicted DsbA family dithiol-disulfide isomerase
LKKLIHIEQIANEKNITGVPFFEIGTDYISGAQSSSNLATAIKNNLN